VRYQNAQMIAEQVLPVMPVNKDSNLYFTYGNEHFKSYDDVRKPGARAKRVEWSVDHDQSYTCIEHAQEIGIPDEVVADQDDPLNVELDSAQTLNDILALKLEILTAAMMSTSGNYASGNSQDLSATGQWSDYKASDPIADVQAAMSVVEKTLGMSPNSLLLSLPVFRVLRNHPKIVERCKYTEDRVVTPQLMANAFEVQRIVVGKAVQDASLDPATPSRSYVWGTQAALFHYGTPGIKTVSFGQIFRRQGFRIADSWYEQDKNSKFIRVRDKYDIKSIATGAGFLFTNAIKTS